MISAIFVLIWIVLALLSRLCIALRDLRRCEKMFDIAIKSTLNLVSEMYPQEELESNEDYRARLREKLVMDAERLSK